MSSILFKVDSKTYKEIFKLKKKPRDEVFTLKVEEFEDFVLGSLMEKLKTNETVPKTQIIKKLKSS
ncbi:MAG: hypothetical protein IPL53_00510 [Ignavibacteria bacterium]|nr:hypothetical protein [Ignavibacteria bacterium]